MPQDLVPQYAALLRQHYLFKGLDESQIAHVVTRFVSKQYGASEVVIRQGEPGDSFYLIFRGRVQVSRTETDRERVLDLLGSGDYFGEEALLFDRPRSATVTTVEPTVLLRLDREPFFGLIQQFPDMRMNLSATAESRYLAQKEKFSWLSPDEVIYLVARKHEFFLYLSLIPPVFAVLLSIPMLSIGLAATAAGALIWLLRILGALFLIGGIGLGVWNWIDWSNDYYIVTSQRVLWIERVIALYNSRREAPLTQILAVNVKTSWLGRIFDFGNVDVRTFTGGILMRRAAHPYLFAQFVEGFQNRAKQHMKAAEAEKMERALRNRLGLDQPVEKPPPPAPVPQRDGPSRKPPRPGSLREKLDTFLRVRYERNGVITYRKHWLLLFRKTALPSLAIVAALIVTGLTYGQIRRGVWPLNLTLSVIALAVVVYIAVGLWWLYHYVDWSNDIYQLAPDQIR